MPRKSTESGLWQWLRRELNDSTVDMMRVENTDCMPGTPDVNGRSLLYGDFWLELKAGFLPVRPTSKAGGVEAFKEKQVKWFRRRLRVEGNVGLLYELSGKRWFVDGYSAIQHCDPKPTMEALEKYGVRVTSGWEILRLLAATHDDW